MKSREHRSGDPHHIHNPVSMAIEFPDNSFGVRINHQYNKVVTRHCQHGAVKERGQVGGERVE